MFHSRQHRRTVWMDIDIVERSVDDVVETNFTEKRPSVVLISVYIVLPMNVNVIKDGRSTITHVDRDESPASSLSESQWRVKRMLALHDTQRTRCKAVSAGICSRSTGRSPALTRRVLSDHLAKVSSAVVPKCVCGPFDDGGLV